MSQWGVSKSQADDEFHIVPCDEEGGIVGGHVHSFECFCRPKPTPDEARVILHHDPIRGGTREGMCD